MAQHRIEEKPAIYITDPPKLYQVLGKVNDELSSTASEELRLRLAAEIYKAEVFQHSVNALIGAISNLISAMEQHNDPQ